MSEEKPKKVYVTGTGRSGTTFLMLIFTHLNLDTGFETDNYEKFIPKNAYKCNSGLERNFNEKPYILKNPQYIGNFEEIIKSIDIDCVIIPMRDYSEAAKSRFRVNLRWNADNLKQQEEWYHKAIAEYVLTMTKYDIPTIFIDFERMITSSEYLYEKLNKVVGHISFEKFNKAYISAANHQKRS